MNIQVFLAKMLLSYNFKNRIFLGSFHISGFWGNHKRKNTYFSFHLWFLLSVSLNPWARLCYWNIHVQVTGMCWSKAVDSHSSHEKPGFRVSSLYSASPLKEEYSPGCKFHLILPSLRLHLTSCVQGCRESQLTQVPFPVLLLSNFVRETNRSIWHGCFEHNLNLLLASKTGWCLWIKLKVKPVNIPITDA